MNSRSHQDDDPQKNPKTPSENPRSRNITSTWLSFILGIVLGTIPVTFYVNASDQKEKSIFRYEPNSIAYKKPEYLQVLQTQKEVQEIQNSGIKSADLAEKGAAVEMRDSTFRVISEKRWHSPAFHLQWIKTRVLPTINQGKKFSFHPNAILTQDPFVIQVLQTQKDVQFSQKQEAVSQKDLLEIGAAIVCSNPEKQSSCHAIGKSALKQQYSKIAPLSELFKYYAPKSS